MTRIVTAVFSLLSLALCLACPLFYFWGTTSEDTYKQILAVASFSWFISATVWATRKEQRAGP